MNLGGFVYADDSSNSSVSNVDSSVDSSSSSVTTTTKETVIGYSSFNIVVSNDDMFTGLEVLVDAYTSDDYASEITPAVKLTLLKLLTSLVISVVTGDVSYTLDTFVDAFVQILVDNGINVTEDVIDAITKYAVHYLGDDLEQDSTDTYLIWIGSSLGLMTTLFITSQQGGVHRA